MTQLLTGITLALALSTGAQATVVSAFAENFEGSLSAWTQRDASHPDGVIVADPLRTGNHVLAFSRTMGSGSLFSTDLVKSNGDFTFAFDYLGLARPGSVAGDIGGYLGVSKGFNGSNQYWLAGTGSYNTPIDLIDDGQWHSYSITFHSPIGQPVRLMLEDWDGSNGVAGDAYFDNLRLNDSRVAAAAFTNAVPEPTVFALLGIAALAAGLASRRRRRA